MKQGLTMAAQRPLAKEHALTIVSAVPSAEFVEFVLVCGELKRYANAYLNLDTGKYKIEVSGAYDSSILSDEEAELTLPRKVVEGFENIEEAAGALFNFTGENTRVKSMHFC